MAILIPKFPYKGIQKIKIPKTDSDFVDMKAALKIIEKYMPSILIKHQQNRMKIKYFHEYALGEQDIKEKERLYNKDCDNNNKITENHAYRQTTFRTAFLTSERRDYAHKSDSDCDDMIYLDRYFTDVDFFAKDKNIKEWVFQTGIGVSYEKHRTDIIKVENNKDKKVYSFKTEKDGFDIKTEAPFEFDDLDPQDNFVVYSSIRGENPLFCVTLVEVEDDAIKTSDLINYKYLLYIETRYARYVANCDLNFSGFKDLKFEIAKSFHSMPMIEHCTNNARLGIVELNRDLFNCINTIISNTLDMIVDGANVILVFKNTDIDQKTINEMKQKGALLLSDNPENKNGSEAKLETIKLEINFEGLNAFYEERLAQSYDIAGVPLASGQVTSGGDTGQARLLGGGWNNAYTITRNDITTILKGDYQVLKGLLAICKDTPGCPVNEISASQIDIKYHINQSDNLLVKAQSISQLYSINMPKEEILKVTGLFNDVCAVGKKWETEDARAIERNAQKELAQTKANATDQKVDDSKNGKEDKLPDKTNGNTSKE